MAFHSMHFFASDFFYSTFCLGWWRVIHFATDLSLSVNSATGHIFRELRAAIMTPSINPLEKGMQPTPVFLPGESHGQRRAWWATVHGVSKSRTRLSDFHSLTLTRIPTGPQREHSVHSPCPCSPIFPHELHFVSFGEV